MQLLASVAHGTAPFSQALPFEADMARIVQDQTARQGQKGRPVLMVLIGGLFLVGIYLIGMLVSSGLTSPESQYA